MVVNFGDMSSHLKQYYSKKYHISFKNRSYLKNNRWQKTSLDQHADSPVVGHGHKTGTQIQPPLAFHGTKVQDLPVLNYSLLFYIP